MDNPHISAENKNMYLAKKLDTNIFLYKNVLDDPKKFVSLLEELDAITETHAALHPWETWSASDDNEFLFGHRKTFNQGELSALPEQYRNTAKYLIDQISNGLNSVASAYIKDRNLSDTLTVNSFSGVMRYEPGTMMGSHFDAQGGDETLTYSIVLYINDDYEGGEISFTVRDYDLRDPEYSDLKADEDLDSAIASGSVDYWYKPEAGSALVFPSTYPYNHQVHLIRSGNRYMSPGYILNTTTTS